MDPTAVIRDGWEKALAGQQDRLKKKRYAGILQSLDYDSFQTTITEEDKRYRKRNIAKHMESLSLPLQHLHSFVGAITTMSSSKPEIAGLVWGGIQVVLVMASKFTGIMERITSMIKDLTEHLTKLHQYLDLFPGEDLFSCCTKCIIQHYVGFCISALKFFRRWPLYSLLQMLWRTLDLKFEGARKEIEANVRRFDTQRQYVVDRTLVTSTRRIEAVLPKTVIQPAEPEQLYEVPYSRNARFCGRDEILSELHNALIKGMSPQSPSQIAIQPSSCVVYGMGGVGKTQVALEYTYRYRDSYDLIFWIQAENEAVLVTSITKISSALDLRKEVNTSSKDIIVEGVRKWLEKTKKRWLLVFDNAETWSLLEPCLPRANHGAILITSQDPQLCPRVQVDLHLEPFNSTEGSELILKHLPKTGAHHNHDIGDAKKISAQLGGLPLALGYVAGYISKTSWSLQEFLNVFEERQVSASIFAMPPPTTTHQYEKSLAMVWEVSLQKLEADQHKVIQILSMLNPDGVPEEMLYTNHQEPELAFLSSSKVQIHNFGTMIGDLATRHLVTRETVLRKPQLLIHRSLQKSVLHNLDKDFSLFQLIFELALALIRKVYPKQSPTHDPQNEYWGTQELYQPHILSLHSVYKKSAKKPVAPIAFAELLSDAVYYFWERGTLRDGKLLTNTAEEICEQYPGSYTIKANIYSLGGALRWSRGITERAPIMRRFLTALALLQKHINELPTDEATPEILRLYATSWNDVGHTFIEHEFYEDAIQCLDLCATIKGGLGDQLGVWGANCNKALALTLRGRFNEALKLIPEDDKVLPDLLLPGCASFYERCRFAWANILVTSGNLQRAHELLEDNLSSRKLLCGESGHFTLDSYYLLGITQLRMGNTQVAIDYFKKALENSSNWSEESKSLAKHHLSKALAGIGNHAEAKVFHEEAEAVRQDLWATHATYISDQGQCDDETYDHLASCEMGRITIGKFQTSRKLPKLMMICQEMQERLDALGTGSVLPSACCTACKSPEIDVSEAEIYGTSN